MDAGVRPLLPLLHVAMLDRIVVNVVDARLEMTLRAHDAVLASAPDLATAFIVLAVHLK